MHVLSTALTSFLLTMLQQVFTFDVIIQCVVFFSLFFLFAVVRSSRTPSLLTTREEDHSHERMAYLNEKRIVFSLVHFQSDFYGISDALGARMREHEKLNEENKSKKSSVSLRFDCKKKGCFVEIFFLENDLPQRISMTFLNHPFLVLD